MALEDIKVPDIGEYTDVDIIEISVKPGDEIKEEDSLITLETDKASMEIPAPKSGVVKEVCVNVGDKISEGGLILKLETAGGGLAPEPSAQQSAPAPSPAPAPASSGGSVVEVKVPDIGDYKDVDIIEVNVKPGDEVKEEDSLITLETDKASMEIPSPQAGIVKQVSVSVGDKISEGGLILTLTTAGGASESAPAESASPAPSPVPASGGGSVEVKVPDIGDYSGVDVIEVNVSIGDEVKEEDSLITLETDKASMEIPAPSSGKVKELKIKVGDKVSQGDLILVLEGSGGGSQPAATSSAPQQSAPAPTPSPAPQASAPVNDSYKNENVHAGPAVRRLARVLGVDLTKVKPSGRKGRVTKEDCEAYIKNALSQIQSGAVQAGGGGAGLDLLPDPKVDFSKFGEIEIEPLTKILSLIHI